jgi:2-keto-myo-inositol isomerase
MFPFKTALNTSTLFPFALDIKQQVKVVAEAGYEGIELWVKDILIYLETGGTIANLKDFVTGSGISIVDVIAFYRWADADDLVREQALAQAERELVILANLGCLAVAAPPAGNVENVSLETMAGYFVQLVNIARRIGVEPYLEFWGMTKPLCRLSSALFIAMESGLTDVKILLDHCHMHIGGSKLNGLKYLKGANIGIVHVDDYCEGSSENTDEGRVFPGEGILPTHDLAKLLYSSGYRGYLSLELFIKDYGKENALEVARRGLNAIKLAYSI